MVSKTPYRTENAQFGIVKNSICLLAVMGWSAQGSNAELHWSTVSPSPSAEHLMGIAHGNGLYVAVGFNGIILTSLDGSAWTASPNTSGVTLYGVCAKDGLFVAVGEAGTIVTSQDGSTWTTRTSPVTGDLKSVAWSGARFVAVGSSNTVITSETGEDWTQQTFEYSTDLNSVAWGNNMFVAVGFEKVIYSKLEYPDLWPQIRKPRAPRGEDSLENTIHIVKANTLVAAATSSLGDEVAATTPSNSLEARTVRTGKMVTKKQCESIEYLMVFKKRVTRVTSL